MSGSRASGQEAATPALSDAHQNAIGSYCLACHNDGLSTAGLSLESADVTDPVSDAAIWEKVIRKLSAKAMPPAGMPRPDDEAYEAITTYLETTLDNLTQNLS